MPLTYLEDTAVNVNNFATLKMQLSGPGGRWIETHDLIAEGVNAVKAKCLVLIEARRHLLAGGVRIDSGMFGYEATKPDGYPLTSQTSIGELIYDDDAAAQETTMDPCNNVSTAFQFRFQANNGKFSSQVVRGIRDKWVNNDWYDPVFLNPFALSGTYAVGGPYLGGTNPGDPVVYNDGVDTATELVRNYCSLVRDLTVMHTPDPIVDGLWQQYTFQFYDFVEVRTRQTGITAGTRRGRQRSFA